MVGVVAGSGDVRGGVRWVMHLESARGRVMCKLWVLVLGVEAGEGRG